MHNGSPWRPRQGSYQPKQQKTTLFRYILLFEHSSELVLILFCPKIDSTGAPRPVVNSKGRRRRAGTKTLAQVLRCDDELFVDFVSKCLSWDPERRIKPQSAMRHPFITAGRKSKIVNNATPSSTRTHLASSSSLLSVGRSKPTETPKKSQISAPTPLTARTTRTMNSQIPSTPLGPLAHPTQSSSKSFRSPHVSYHSSRTAGGLTVSFEMLLH